MLGLWRYLLALLIFSAPAALGQTPDFVLTAKIVRVTENGPSVRLYLRNRTKVALTVVTGIYAAKAYPAANFEFGIRLPHGRSFKLYCGSCAPGVIGGTLGAYEIFLRPRELAVVATVPFIHFFIPSRPERRLCSPTARRGDLTISLQGRRWPSGNPGVRDTYWTGNASTIIPLNCDANG
jgi:hypothetical protein